MIDDTELLRNYVEQGSQEAFRELVRRHLNLVYSAALRRVGGDSHRAKDVTQIVFSALARKAPSLLSRSILSGWLYTTAHLSALQTVRAEVRRQKREEKADLMNEMAQENHADWDQLRPVLDDLMHELREGEREAVLLRFFEGKSFGDLGRRLSLTEDAARMRVERALEKMRIRLEKKGIKSTTVALGTVLTAHAVSAAPAGLAPLITSVALASAASGGGILVFMATHKLAMGLLGAVVLTGASGAAMQQHTNARLRAELIGLRLRNDEIAELQMENRALSDLKPDAGVFERDDKELARLALEAQALKSTLAQRLVVKAAATGDAPCADCPPMEANQLDRMPVAKHRVAPIYPSELRIAGVTGEVLVSFIVDTSGVVQGAYAVSSTHREFEAAAIEAVAQWLFEPGKKGGRTVNTRMRVPIVFSLPGENSPATPYPDSEQKEQKSTKGWF